VNDSGKIKKPAAQKKQEAASLRGRPSRQTMRRQGPD
jgi:hypothetical protein